MPALNSSALFRLKRTWEALPRASRRDFDELGDLVNRRGEAEHAPDRAAAGPVARLVERDAREPRRHGPVRIEAAERAVGRYERLLHEVERLVRIGDVGEDEAIDALAVPSHDLGERFVVPGSRPAGARALTKSSARGGLIPRGHAPLSASAGKAAAVSIGAGLSGAGSGRLISS